jgi:carboxyl-terminal processing protease
MGPDHPFASPRRASSWRLDAVHLIVGVACGLLLASLLQFATSRLEPDLARYREMRDFVQANYVREVSPEELLERALQGMVDGLDPYSRYYDRSAVASLDRETSGHYLGIGIVFSRPLPQAGGEFRVLFSLPGSPAERAGIRPGDRIVSVDGRSVEQLGSTELQALISGAQETVLRLEVAGRDRRLRALEVRRQDLIDPTVRHARLLDRERGIGYVAISSFSQATPEEFDGALEGMRSPELRALVVDVRGNLGGVLSSAVQVANRFVPRGLLVSREGRGAPVNYEAEPKLARFASLPLVVLVDGDSASASEVFAAALQEHRAAVVVGSPTYGKGVVQQMKRFQAPDGVAKITTSYYYTPSHRNLERTLRSAWDCGVVPDLQVELSPAEARRIHAFLASYSPPEAALGELEAWEREEGVEVVPTPPADAQLEAALALFRGERPGAYLAEAGR